MADYFSVKNQPILNPPQGVDLGSINNQYQTVYAAGNLVINNSTFTASTIGVPKISNIQITNSSGTVLDDTAIGLSGGYIKINGSGFAAGAQVIVNNTAATSTTFISASVLNAQVGAQSAGSYVVYVSNTDGGSAILWNGLTYSATPTWVTGTTLSTQTSGVAISIQLSATGANTYALATGSSLPAGLSLSSGGLLSGTVTVGSETVYSFTVDAIDTELQESPRTFSLTVQAVTAPSTVEYLVVAGGGGGAWGGGGAGGLLTSQNQSVISGTSYTIVVGAGGGGNFPYNTTLTPNGSNSSVFSATAVGGGGGGAGGSGFEVGRAGGSGGGSRDWASTNTPGGLGTAGPPRQGFNGGAGSSVNNSPGGGGGGATQAGSAGSYVSSGGGYTVSGNGGNGFQSNITGTATYYAGGGAGGTPFGATQGTPGLGGGGTDITPGTQNTGGGGGANCRRNDEVLNGTNGGSGIVIIRYPDSFTAAASTTGSPTITVTGGYRIYTFTGSGSITF